MTRHYDDWSAPFPVRTLRWLREELAEVERMIPEARRRCFDLVIRKHALRHAIDDNERYIREKGDDVD